MDSDPVEVRDLFDRIARCLPYAVSFRGCAFRSVGVRYANENDILAGGGASYFGGRWNRPGIRAIYASLDPATAVRESYQEFIKYGFKGSAIRPRVLAGIRLKLKRALDLRDARIRRRLGFNRTELIGEDWRAIQFTGQESWTQAIGRGALLAGFEGLLAPSARDRHGAIAVIFPENLRSGEVIELMSPEDLPPHPSSWTK